LIIRYPEYLAEKFRSAAIRQGWHRFGPDGNWTDVSKTEADLGGSLALRANDQLTEGVIAERYGGVVDKVPSTSANYAEKQRKK